MKRTANQLEASIAANEGRTEGCGWYVVIGLTIELLVAAIFRDHRSLVESFAAVLADIFVVGGVYGEVHFSRKLRFDVEELQRISNERIAELGVIANDARERAAKAELRLERLKLPRFISDEQHKALVEGLKHVPPGEVYLRPGTQDADAIVYGEMFKKAFAEAGRELSPYPGSTPVFWSWSGLWLLVRDRSKPPKHAMDLWNCLKAAGFEVPWWGSDEKHPENGVTLGIGGKL